MLLPRSLSRKSLAYAALLALYIILLLYYFFFDAEGVLPVQFVHKVRHDSCPGPNPQNTSASLNPSPPTPSTSLDPSPPTPSPDAEPTPSGIPKKLWFKLGPAGLNDNTRKWTSSCIQSNPDYRVEFMTEASGDAFVIQTFSSTRPEIVATYLRLTVPILKADWLRYMLLYDQGGIWFDLDVECHVPIDEWIPSEHKNASVVVGLEFDVSPRFKEPFPRQFNSWTVMAKPRSPHLLQVIHDIQDSIATVTQQKNVKVQDLTKEMVGDVVLFTGPRRLKDGIYKSLGRVLNTTIQDSHIWKATRPKMLGDVLVMPGQSFAASMNNYAPELQQELPPKLVTHHYAGSWKNDKGGETR